MVTASAARVVVAVVILLNALLAASVNNMNSREQDHTDVRIQKQFLTLSENRNSNEWQMLAVGLVQYPLEGYLTLEQLLKKVDKYISEASEQKVQLLLLPELFCCDLLDYSKSESEQLNAIAAEITPKLVDGMRLLAIKYHLYLAAGSVPVMVPKAGEREIGIDGESEVHNRAYLFSSTGDEIYQEKIFLTPDEEEWGWQGANTLTIFKAPWGNTALVICYDSEFPIITGLLSNYLIDLLLVPSMTGDSGFTRVRWASQARAVEHMAYVMVTGVIGSPAKGWEMKGQAAVLGPSLANTNPLLAEGTINQDEIVYAKLNMSLLSYNKQQKIYYPSLKEYNVNVNSDFKEIK